MNHELIIKNRAGQALAEILISVTISGLVLGSAAFVAVSVINSNKSINQVKAATGLARELMDSVRVYADSDWKTFYELSKGSGNHYYLDVSATPFTAVSGDGSVSQDSVTYTRYFYVENVNRGYDSADDVASVGGAEDPATQKITVGVSWLGGDALTFTEYMSQWRNYTAVQSDWSGGTGQAGAVTRLGNDYFSSTSINASTTGEFKLSGY